MRVAPKNSDAGTVSPYASGRTMIIGALCTVTSTAWSLISLSGWGQVHVRTTKFSTRGGRRARDFRCGRSATTNDSSNVIMGRGEAVSFPFRRPAPSPSGTTGTASNSRAVSSPTQPER